MLSIATPQGPNFAWLLDDPCNNAQSESNYYFSGEKTPTSGESIDLPSPSSQAKNGDFASFCDELNSQGNKTVKKLNHNASERDRRKKINNLYTTLRSLLPSEDQSKKLSIPNTISRVLKYIPELQTEVERLVRKRESFKSKIWTPHDDDGFKGQNKTSQYSASVISATQINNEEIIIQISVPKVAKSLVSEALMILEQEGFVVLTSSCSESSHNGRVFSNFHLQGVEGQVVDAEMLKRKLLSFYGLNCNILPMII